LVHFQRAAVALLVRRRLVLLRLVLLHRQLSSEHFGLSHHLLLEEKSRILDEPVAKLFDWVSARIENALEIGSRPGLLVLLFVLQNQSEELKLTRGVSKELVPSVDKDREQ